MKTKTFFTCWALVLSLTSCSAADKAEKEREIRKLLDATGTTKALADVMNQTIAYVRGNFPDVPQRFWDEYQKEMNVEELVELMMPIYEKHLSLSDIKAANVFYSSPAGRRLAEKTSILTTEGFEIGRKWGEAKTALIVERLKETGFNVPGGSKSTALGKEDLEKITGNAEITWSIGERRKDILRCNIYNGSRYSVTEVTVRLVIEGNETEKEVTRDYRIQPKDGGVVPSLSNGTFETEIGLNPNKRKWTWSIISVMGVR